LTQKDSWSSSWKRTFVQLR